jgi:N-acetylglucosamine-6-sulfatase
VFPRVYKSGYKAIRTERYKLIQYTDLDGMDEFYDLLADPYEMHNRIDDPAQSERVEELRGRLSKLLES